MTARRSGLLASAMLGALLACGPGQAVAPAAAAQAQALADRGEHARAAELFARAASEAGDAARALALRAGSGLCLRLAGREAQAAAVLEGVRTAVLAVRRAAPVGPGEARHFTWEDRDLVDRLAELAHQAGVPWLEVWVLELSADGALAAGDARGARARLERALRLDRPVEPPSSRHDALVAQLARLRMALGDDEGAARLWRQVSHTPEGQLGGARHRFVLEQYAEAAEQAWEAALSFDREGSTGRIRRDAALLLHVESLLAAGRQADCARALSFGLGPERDADLLQLVRARLAMTNGAWAVAVEDLQALASRPDAPEVAAPLLAVALLADGRTDRAQEVLDRMPPSVARTTLAHLADPGAPSETVAVRAAQWDDSLHLLSQACPVPIPSAAWTALDLAMAQAGRLREAGQLERASRVEVSGVREALARQAVDALQGVRADRVAWQAARDRLHGWTAGELAAGRAVVALIPGDPDSYLVVCTSGGVGVYRSAGSGELRDLVRKLDHRLRRSGVLGVARVGHELFGALFGTAARAALRGRDRWTLILPGAFGAVPPALWVSTEPVPDQPVRWLVRDVAIGQLPHAFAGAAPPPAAQGAPGRPPGPVVRLSDPFVDLQGLLLAGRGPGGPVVDGAPPSAGSGPRVFDLRRVLPGARALVLSVPGSGGGRLGGLFFAPDPAAAWGDEAGGFLPWHRLPELDLPPLVVCDRTRFLMSDELSRAATAVQVRASELLLTRWPAGGPRRALVESVLAQVDGGVPLAVALAGAQRQMLEAARRSAREEQAHPRAWGSWLAFSGR